MERAPLLVLGAAAAAGVALVAPLPAALTACIAAVAALGLARFRMPAALALAAGMLSAALHAPPRTFTERIVRMPCTMLSAQSCVSDDGTTFSVATRSALAPAGTRELLRARLVPFDGARNPGEPDFAAIEHERGLQGELQSAHVLRALPARCCTPAIVIARMQSWALERFRASLGEPYVSVLAGELWGEKRALPPELRTEFQETGTVHILVTAGLHIGVVTMLFMAVLRACRLPRIAVSLLSVCGVWAYVAFSGAHLPSIRAACMATFGLAAFACGAAPLSWNAYGAAVFAIAVFRPESITSASFSLSFSCVGSILLLASRIERALASFEMPHALREAASLSCATQIGTWPLTAAIFTIFAPYAVVANILVVPVVGLTMMLAAAQLLALPLSPLADSFAAMNRALLQWILDCVRTFSSLPHAAVPLAAPSTIGIAAYDAAVVFAAHFWDRARTAALGAVALCVLFIAAPPPSSDGKLRVTVLDVGQADAIVVRTPAHHLLLVDAGGRLEHGAANGESSAEEVGERVVVPFLRRAGVTNIDAMIVSHPHGDHVGGAAPVLRNYGTAGEFADSGQRYGGYAYNDALNVAKTNGVPIVYPRAGTIWHLADGVTLTFIGPSLPFIESNNAINDNSIAFILQYKRFRMLFTGDAGVAAERRFLSEGIDLHADVLKVGHHGSAYSSGTDFIAAVHPKYAVISVGRHNMFGHPAPSTMKTLQRFGTQIYRTDEDGAVTITTDGRKLQIAQMLP